MLENFCKFDKKCYYFKTGKKFESAEVKRKIPKLIMLNA